MEKKEGKYHIFVVKTAAKEDRKRTTAGKKPGRRWICIGVCTLQLKEICLDHIKKKNHELETY